MLLTTSAMLLGSLAQAAVGAGPPGPGGAGAAFLRGPAKGAPAVQATRAAHVPGCSLHAGAGTSVRDEWLSCLKVAASLDRVPTLGQTAALRFSVTADADLPGTTVDVQLPAGLQWVRRPAGLQQRVSRSARPEDRGTVTTASTRVDLRRGQVLHFSGTVRAARSGAAQIRVRALAPHGGTTQAGADAVFLTVGAPGAASTPGIAAGAHGSAVPTVHGPAVPSTSRVSRSVGTAGLAAPVRTSAGAASPCDTRVTGNWGYRDQNNAWHDSANFQVQVWDADVFGDTLLANGVTDGAGNYNLCFDAQSEGLFDSGTADVYVRFVSSNSIWQVQRGGSPLTFTTGTTNDITPGSTLALGSLSTGDGALSRGLHAFDEANDAWQFVPKPRNLCFDQKDTTCRQLRINWAPDSTDGTYYSTGSNDVHLAADDPNAHHTVVHEISHAIMDDVYDDAFPSAPSCNPHSIEGTSSTGCAWTEGFAEWLPATVYNDPFFRWPNGASLDLETPSWGNGWGEGDTTEGRIAGALIDITDGANEGPWDRFSEGSAGIWSTFTHHVSGTLGQFWAQRAADGFDTSDAGALAALYQNTIDDGLRDPLAPYVPLNRPNPVPAHNYGFGTTTAYWSAVALRPQVGADHDLSLYDDRALTAPLSGSAYGGSTIDFVAVDSNRRPFGDYYPRVNRFAGSGPYQVELAQGSQVVSPGSTPIAMGAGDVVAVRDVFLGAGTTTTVRVAPTQSGQDPEVFLMASDAGSSSWVRPRNTAVAGSSAAGAGGAEQFSYTAPASGWYGLVVLNKQGSGTYTVTRDDSAPTGSVLINGGAASTNRRWVSLALAASDPQSGVTAMRVSTDGALDTEAWTSYATTQAAWLPGSNGAKTVLAQFRNGVGGVSPVVSDTIVLALPDLYVRAVSNPPASAAWGRSFWVTDTTRDAGPGAAAASTTRYYLSTDAVRGPTDRLLAGARAVPGLPAGAQTSGSRTVGVPVGTPLGTYRLLACADDLRVVGEGSEANNCRASAGSVRVTAPDLRVRSVTSGTRVSRGSSLRVTDTAVNTGSATAAPSRTGYYLSSDTVLGAGDRVLTGSRAVPSLVVGAASSGSVLVGVPATTPAGLYRLIARADATRLVAESSEADNTLASPVVVRVV